MNIHTHSACMAANTKSTVTDNFGFDLSQMSDSDCQAICSTFLSEIRKFYADPENVKKFKRWEAAQKRKASA